MVTKSADPTGAAVVAVDALHAAAENGEADAVFAGVRGRALGTPAVDAHPIVAPAVDTVLVHLTAAGRAADPAAAALAGGAGIGGAAGQVGVRADPARAALPGSTLIAGRALGRTAVAAGATEQRNE